jgi:two-component system OmpR family response regulator
MRELLARIKALLRRTEMTKPQPVDDKQPIVIDDLKIDIARHQVFLKGSTLELTPKEFDLVAYLARNKGFVFSREQLLEKVWGYDYTGDTRTVDVHVRWLRQKIEREPSKPKRLVTVRGAGYKLQG